MSDTDDQVRRGFGGQRHGRKYFSKYFESDDGLNLLRVDELYDSDSDGLDQDDIDADAWRALWVGTYRPGSLGALLHKSVYESPSATSPPS
jgi:hypothetical protein